MPACPEESRKSNFSVGERVVGQVRREGGRPIMTGTQGPEKHAMQCGEPSLPRLLTCSDTRSNTSSCTSPGKGLQLCVSGSSFAKWDKYNYLVGLL